MSKHISSLALFGVIAALFGAQPAQSFGSPFGSFFSHRPWGLKSAFNSPSIFAPLESLGLRRMARQPRKVRSYADPDTCDLLIEIQAGPEFSRSDGYTLDLNNGRLDISEKCTLENKLLHGCRDFKTSFEVPSAVTMDQISGKWLANSNLMLRIPGAACDAAQLCDDQSMLVEDDSPAKTNEDSQTRVAQQQSATRQAKGAAQRQAQAKAEAEATRQAQLKAQAKLEAEKRATRQAERRAQQQKAEQERLARIQAEQEAEQKAKLEAKRQAAIEAKQRAELQAKQKQQREAQERKAMEQAERDAKRRVAKQAKRRKERQSEKKAQRQTRRLATMESNVVKSKTPIQQHSETACQANSRIAARRHPGTDFEVARILAVDDDSDALVVAWDGGGVSIVPQKQEYIVGCELSKHHVEVDDTADGDDWLEVEDLESDDHEEPEKDGDASDGYYLLGEFHYY